MPLLNIEVLFDYLWPRFDEGIILYRVSGEKLSPDIEYHIDSSQVRFGDTFRIEYNIINNNEDDIRVTSLELDVPDGIGFEGVSGDGKIKDTPSNTQGKFMWVRDYDIEGGGSTDIVLDFRALKPGLHAIRFRITSQDTYFEAEDVGIEVLK